VCVRGYPETSIVPVPVYRAAVCGGVGTEFRIARQTEDVKHDGRHSVPRARDSGLFCAM
jgi:hypothetical protein